MFNLDNEALAASFMVVSQGVVLYTVLSPDLKDLRRTHPSASPGIATDVRVSEITAGLLLVATGVIGSVLAKSPLPFWIALVVGAMMTGAIELVFNLDPRKVIG